MGGSAKWSEEANSRTRDAIDDARLGFVPIGDQLHMKHIDDRFGAMAIEELMHGIFRIVDKKNGKAIVFESVQDLIQADWVVD